MNDTANPPDRICTFESLCGFGGIAADETPNQWWRFITPIFLHAGFVHILLNMLAQLTAGAQVRLNCEVGKTDSEPCSGRERDGICRLLPALLRRWNFRASLFFRV